MQQKKRPCAQFTYLFSDSLLWWWCWGVTTLTCPLVVERWVSHTHGGGNPELSRPPSAHMQAGRREWICSELQRKRQRDDPSPSTQDLMFDAVWGWSSLCRASQGGLIPRQQDSPKFNYGTRLASKDSSLMNVPSCTWSALSQSSCCAGCSTEEQRGGKWQMSSA